ncbi:MAG: T9SS type A sorting domain-containing protein [Bacteroidales bacterium]|nr:T9SS type A sorting domain-containing protein [Bacteroidales bacterium]
MKNFNFLKKGGLFLSFFFLASALMAQTTLINENIQSWTNRGSYGNYTQTINVDGGTGNVTMTNCMVANAASATGTCSAGRVQLRASDGVLELPQVSSVSKVTFGIVAGGSNRNVKLETYNGSSWSTIYTFTGIGTTGATFTYDINVSSATRIRLSAPSSAIYVHDIKVESFVVPTVDDPSNFTAIANGKSQVDLDWVLNSNDNLILLAWSSNGTFGTPTGTYTAGDDIIGGGKVLYIGDDLSFNHTGLNYATTYYYKIWSYDDVEGMYSTGLTDDAVTDPQDEPSNQPTNFTATTQSYYSIKLTWTDASGTIVPDGYLILMSDVSYGDLTAPTDGTPVGNGVNAKNIAYGVEEYLWTGLDSETEYFFKMYPYTNSGVLINYKTDGFVSQSSDLTSDAPDLIAHFNFEDATKRGSISNTTEWELYPYSADDGTTANKDIALISTFGGVVYSSWLSSARPNFNGWDNGEGLKYWQIKISTVGYKNLQLSSRQRSSDTGPRDFKAQYSINGYQWYNIPGAELIYLANDAYPYSAGVLNNVTLPQVCNNEEEVYIRWIMRTNIAVNNGNTLSGGTSTIDDIQVNGFPITGGTYNPNIVIDGLNQNWQSSEIFDSITPIAPNNAAEFAHFTWDNNYIYFGISGAHASYDKMATFMFFNTNPDNMDNGTTNVYAWGQNIIAPFKVNAVLIWKNESVGQDYMEFAQWDGNTWNTQGIPTNNLDLGYFNPLLSGLMLHFEIGANYREISIPRAILGLQNPGAKFKIASFTEQQFGTNWRYFGWPSPGWTDGNRAAGQTMTHAYEYELKEFVYPNENRYIKEDIYFIQNSTISTSETYDNVYIEPNVHLEVSAGQTLDVNNNFTIMSNANGTGTFIDFGTLNVAGNTIVQKYFADNTQTGWYFSSPSTYAQSILFENFDGLYEFNPNTAVWDPTAQGNLTPMRGYVTKNEGEDLKVEFWGSLNTGHIENNALIRTGFNSGNYGWNLVGNPYPSTIDWDAPVGIDKDNLMDATYIRKADGTIASYINQAGTNQGSRYIPPMQAFWVQVYGDAGTPTGNGYLHLENTARVSVPTNMMKAAQNNDELKLIIERENYTDESIIRFIDGASDVLDRNFDASKMFAEIEEYPQIYSSDAQNDYVINSYPQLIENKSVNIGFTTSFDGDHTISANNINSFNSNVSLHLEDLQTNTLIDLKNQNSYTFNTSKGTHNNRFIVHFTLTPTSIGNELENAISVFANENNIYISNSLNENFSVTIYNLLGQEVVSEQINGGGLHKISTNLISGQYIVRITGINKSISEKVFIY